MRERARGWSSAAMHILLLQDWDYTRLLCAIFRHGVCPSRRFYFVFPWACVWVCRLRLSALLPVAFALALSRLAIALAYLALSSASGVFQHQFWSWAAGTSPPSRLPEFLLGMVLGRLFLVRPATRIRQRDLAAALALASIVGIFALGPLPRGFSSALLDPFFALLIFALASGVGVFSRLLSIPAMVLLGNAGYAIYILQIGVLKPLYEARASNP